MEGESFSPPPHSSLTFRFNDSMYLSSLAMQLPTLITTGMMIFISGSVELVLFKRHLCFSRRRLLF